jgi:ribosomal protein S16
MINKTDVENVAKSINKTLTNAQIEQVLELYPSEQENDPSGTWDLVIEHCIDLVDEDTKPVKAIFKSYWDGDGTCISTICEYNPTHRTVSNVVAVDVEDTLEFLDKEEIEVGDETLTLFNFDKFQDVWLEQECDKTDFVDKLKKEIGECRDFEDLFSVISLWSNKPLLERVIPFLERNNACILDEDLFCG